MPRSTPPRSTLQGEIQKKRPFELAEQEAMLNIVRTASALNTDFERLFRAHGLTDAQYNVLRILRGEGTRMPSLSIAQRTVTRVPDITRLVDRLENAGLVERERCPEDRRVVYVSITRKGLRKLADLDEPVNTLHTRQLGHLSAKELATLSELLVKARAPGDGAA